MAEINRSRVKRSFSRQAEKYDSLARVQQRVRERFLNIYMADCGTPKAILDVGAGTGALLDSLVNRYPEAVIAGVDLAQGMATRALQRFTGCSKSVFVCADGESLPFKDNSFDLVVSTSTYQWLYPFSRAFAEAWRVLEPGRSFCIALFGEKTLYELRWSYKRALEPEGGASQDRSHVFASDEEVLTSLMDAGFTECSVSSELEVELHVDVPALMRSLKNIGAGNAAAMSGRGLSGRKTMDSMIGNYQREFGMNGCIPATYQVLYCVGVKPCS
jgi:malonyl-CoA O-methyltransferase